MGSDLFFSEVIDICLCDTSFSFDLSLVERALFLIDILLRLAKVGLQLAINLATLNNKHHLDCVQLLILLSFFLVVMQ